MAGKVVSVRSCKVVSVRTERFTLIATPCAVLNRFATLAAS